MIVVVAGGSSLPVASRLRVCCREATGSEEPPATTTMT
jgi:hypothetical protein